MVMIPLARRLQGLGFHTHCWGYSSVWQNIAAHAERFREFLESFSGRADVGRLHIVAHSMGCIVTRQALLEHRPSKLGRVLFLCPPNRGSHVASRLAPALGWLSPTLKELCDHPESWVNRLPTTLADHVPVGIIVASGDLVVARESTAFPGVDQVQVIRGMHAGILPKAETARAAANFLRHGRFDLGAT